MTILHLTFAQVGISPSELAEILNVSLPRIATVLNSLESKNLIEKTTHNEDKRKTIVHITKEGKELVLSKKKEAIDKVEKILEKLDEDDINQYIRLAKKIGKIMEEMQE